MEPIVDADTGLPLQSVHYGIPSCQQHSSIGMDYELNPVLPLPSPNSALAWKWIPDLTLTTIGILYLLSGLFTFLGILLAIVVNPKEVMLKSVVRYYVIKIVLFLIFGIPAALCTFLALRIKMNFNVREAASFAMGKAIQARSLWQNVKNSESAKDVFWKQKTFGWEFIVLRDGTTELWGYSGTKNKYGVPYISSVIDLGAVAAKATGDVEAPKES